MEGEKEYKIFPCNYVDPTKEQQRDAAGRWVEDDIELRNMARNFYIFLYSKEPVLDYPRNSSDFLELDVRELTTLNWEVSAEEIRIPSFKWVMIKL